MKQKETREVIITYCDYCGKELKCGHSSIELKDDKILDFCNEHTADIKRTCIYKYKEEHQSPLKI